MTCTVRRRKARPKTEGLSVQYVLCNEDVSLKLNMDFFLLTLEKQFNGTKGQL